MIVFRTGKEQQRELTCARTGVKSGTKSGTQWKIVKTWGKKVKKQKQKETLNFIAIRTTDYRTFVRT